MTGNNNTKSDIPAGLWLKCKSCEEVIYQNSLEANLFVCPVCAYHYSVTAQHRIKQLTDPDSFQKSMQPCIRSIR